MERTPPKASQHWQIPDELWDKVKPLLPPGKPHPLGCHRPRVDDRYDELKGLDWEWQAMDGAMTKAPLGKEETGPNPTDRAKRGVKRSLLVEGHGLPLGLAVEGAKGYDYDEVRELGQEFGYTLHIRARNEEAQALKRQVGYKARRWVVERTHSWMHRFRGVLIRWDKKVENHLAFLHFACAWITYRAAGLLG